MNEPYPPLLWERCLRRLNRVTAAPSATANVSPWEAASLLELIPFCPRNVTVEYTLERPLLWPFGQHKQEVKVDEVQDLYPGLRVRNPPWHRLAGRLAALTSTQAPILKDRAHLINACWALAMLGHPNRLLLRTVRKTVQFALHELSASVLARLVVAVAVEEASGAVGDFAGSSLSTSAKLDREFVDQVALGVFKSAADIRPLSVQISALVAAAGLGRLTSFDMRSAGGSSRDQKQEAISIPIDKLKTIPTRVLIKLLWAAGRLPKNVISDETMGTLQLELRTRDLSPSGPDNEYGRVTSEDLKLYLRHMVDTRSRNAGMKIDDGFSGVCKAMVAKAKEQGEASDPATAAAHLAATDAASLCETLQSFIELKWYNPEALKLLEQLCTVQQRDYYKNKSFRHEKMMVPHFLEICCILAYQLGRFEELIAVYRSLCPGTNGNLPQKTLPVKYANARRLAPRLLGIGYSNHQLRS
jgi:hypothetical protein